MSHKHERFSSLLVTRAWFSVRVGEVRVLRFFCSTEVACVRCVHCGCGTEMKRSLRKPTRGILVRRTPSDAKTTCLAKFEWVPRTSLKPGMEGVVEREMRKRATISYFFFSFIPTYVFVKEGEKQLHPWSCFGNNMPLMYCHKNSFREPTICYIK